MKAFTDYPILELGDISGEEAPIREVKILYYDGDKRCKVVVKARKLIESLRVRT